MVSQAKEETLWSHKQTCQLVVCVLQLPHYFTKRYPSQKKDKSELSLFSRSLSSGTIYDICSLALYFSVSARAVEYTDCFSAER